MDVSKTIRDRINATALCHVDDLAVNVTTEGELTTITLTGTTETYYSKQLAQHNAMQAAGPGVAIVNNIRVR